jgi:hypothetical protein
MRTLGCSQWRLFIARGPVIKRQDAQASVWLFRKERARPERVFFYREAVIEGDTTF